MYHDSEDIDQLINQFKTKIQSLFAWCSRNRIDINWEKTFCMFVTNRRVLLPGILSINGIDIAAVDTFKLLGVTIDNKLKFRAHCANVCKAINTKLFLIDRLFNLSTSVKIEFFKTFILPYLL